jgi:hypothetical protein
MMMSSASNPLAGKLSIKGISHQSPESISHNPLQTGLRIARPNSPAVQVPNIEALKQLDKKANAASSQVAENPTSKFISEIKRRINNAAQNEDSAAIFEESLVSTLGQIKSQFGQDKANEFMNRILTATDSAVEEKSLSKAIGGFFQDIANDPSVSHDAIKKLENIRKSLNSGLGISEEKKNTKTGLGYALNVFFHPQSSVDAPSIKAFDENFERTVLQPTKTESTVMDTTNYDAYLLGKAHFDETGLAGSETAVKIADYLRNQIGNENAAVYLESLTAGSNFVEGLATACSIVVNENGQGAASNFVSFLNGSIKDEISASQNDVSVLHFDLGLNYADDAVREQSLINTFPASGTPGNEKTADGMSLTDLLAANDASYDIKDFTIENETLYNKKHQGLYMFLEGKPESASSGARHGFDLDMTDLYQRYLASGNGSAKTSPELNTPKGNLVDKIL